MLLLGSGLAVLGYFLDVKGAYLAHERHVHNSVRHSCALHFARSRLSPSNYGFMNRPEP